MNISEGFWGDMKIGNVDDIYRLDFYDYSLPTELIAYEPGEGTRDRLLVVDRENRKFKEGFVGSILEYLNSDTLVVFNNTKVIPARLIGIKQDTGGKVDVLLIRAVSEDKRRWKALIKPLSRMKLGQRLLLEDRLKAVYQGGKIIEFEDTVDIGLLEEIGRMPLPPYIKRLPGETDKVNYQTVYARHYGAVAAPTAGLHFDHGLMQEIADMVWGICYVTLHVGYGTFSPIKSSDIREHRMHKEEFFIDRENLRLLREAISSQKRILAVGTTTVRVLETLSCEDIYDMDRETIEGSTDIFIYPGYKFKFVDMLFTNFHLPKSSLLLLVCAFADRDLILRAYKYAIEQRYRFFSYGDAMLII